MTWTCRNKKPWWMRSYRVQDGKPEVVVEFKVKWWAIPIILLCKKTQWFNHQAWNFADSHDVVIGRTPK